MEWAFENIGKVLLCVMAFVVIGTAALVWADHLQRQEFMSQCSQDRAKYECTAMWRTGYGR